MISQFCWLDPHEWMIHYTNRSKKRMSVLSPWKTLVPGNYQMTHQLLIKPFVTAHRLFIIRDVIERCTLGLSWSTWTLCTTDRPAPGRSLPCWRSAAAAHWQSWYTAAQSCSLRGPAGEHRSRDVASNTQSDRSVVFQVFRSQSTRNTNLKPVDVHYTHSAVHLCGTEPVIDLLQQPVKQHRI